MARRRSRRGPPRERRPAHRRSRRAHGHRCCPTRARPCSSAKRTTRSCHGRPRAVGLKVSMRPGGRVSSASSRRRSQHPALGAQRVGHERMGRDREAARVVDRRRSSSAASGTAGSGRSTNSASRWPPSVVTSSPTMTSSASPRSAAIDRAATAASMRSWSVMAMTSRSPCRATWSRMLPTSARPVRRDGVDVQVGPAATFRHGVRARRPRACVAAARSRSGQIGKNTAHHCSGASSMTRSKARAMAAIVAVTRSRRLPSAGTSTGSRRPRSGPAASAAHRPRRPAPRSPRPGSPGRAAAAPAPRTAPSACRRR